MSNYNDILNKTCFLDIKNKLESFEEFNERIDIPSYISNNLKHTYREYQEGAIKNLIFVNDIYKKIDVNLTHNLFHMATGSGKTMIIASVILYMYEKGYRKFIFTTNNTNLIEKTRNNLLLERRSPKLEFKKHIEIDGKNIKIKEVQSFSKSPSDIEIIFTTIHKLHSEKVEPKENGIDFSKHDIIILADEAHHFQATQSKKEKDTNQTWEDSVFKILDENKNTRLFEFTATIDWNNKNILNKYKDKLIFDYPLINFRKDKFSKEIELIQLDNNQSNKIKLSLIINQIRLLLASRNKIPLIPRILFKCQGTIKEMEIIQKEIEYNINSLNKKNVTSLLNNHNINIKDIIETELNISIEDFIKTLKRSYSSDSIIIIHSKDPNKDEKLKIINNIDNNKNLRIILAINILNEGWDVLSLFDIVKMDVTKTGKKETTSEAQLIGRGARLFPYGDSEYRFKRKYDDNVNHILRLLETMYFYSSNDNKYINNLKQALIELGLKDKKSTTTKTIIPTSDSINKFNEILNNKELKVFANKKVELDLNYSSILDYFKTKKTNLFINYSLDFFKRENLDEIQNDKTKVINKTIKFEYLIKNNSFIINRVIRKLDFLNIQTLKYKNYDGLLKELRNKDININIELKTTKEFNKIEELSYNEKYLFILHIFNEIKSFILNHKGKYKGTNKLSEILNLKETFKDYSKSIHYTIEYGQPTEQGIHKNATGSNLSKNYCIEHSELFYYDKFTWDSEPELELCSYLDQNIPEEQKKNFLIIRNENNYYKLFNSDTEDTDNCGKGFCPDFIIIKINDNQTVTQFFIEVKSDNDREDWKKKILKELLTPEEVILDNETGINYKLIGIPSFYTNKEYNDTFSRLLDINNN